ncbi:MAG: hypothetical protein ABJN69_14065 [Hellea sp.]
MSEIWVCKQDGAIQCDSDSQEIPLDVMREELEALIGAQNVLDAVKRHVIMPQLCGLPAGGINSYLITPQGKVILERGTRGPQGFTKCSSPDDAESVEGENESAGLSIGRLTKNQPVLIRELVGHSLRVYTVGEALTQDWRPGRFNIGMDKNGAIAETWFG